MTIETARETAATFFNQLDDAQAQLKDAQSKLADTQALLDAARVENANLKNRFDAFEASANDTRAYLQGLLTDANARADKYQALTINLAKGSQLFATLVKAGMDDLYNQAAKALVVEPIKPETETEKSGADALDDGIAKIAQNFGAGRSPMPPSAEFLATAPSGQLPEQPAPPAPQAPMPPPSFLTQPQ